jgi:hypothetical protein
MVMECIEDTSNSTRTTRILAIFDVDLLEYYWEGWREGSVMYSVRVFCMCVRPAAIYL